MKKIVNYLLDKKNIIKKIFFTLIIIFIYIFGTQLYIPGLKKEKYSLLINKDFGLAFNFNNPIGFINSKYTLGFLSLGIMPYITSSIILQFMQKVIPAFKEWEEQGEKGKYKINFITRILTVLFALGPGISSIYISGIFDLKHEKLLIFTTLFFLIIGSFICIWLSDLITTKGIGNGISILIVIGMSQELFQTFTKLTYGDEISNLYKRFSILFLFLLLLVLTVILCSAYLKIPIYYASNEKNYKIDNNIPIKMNSSGIMPIILTNTLLGVLYTIKSFTNQDSMFSDFYYMFEESKHYLGLGFFIYLILILLFSFFSTFMAINPWDIAEHLSKQSAYLEGIKPGEETAREITKRLLKLTIVGAIFLTLLSGLPDIITYCFEVEKFKLNGTSLIIVVGVAIDCFQRINETTNVKKMYNKLF